MGSTDLVLITRAATHRGVDRPTARRAVGRPGIQSLVLGLVAAWRRVLRPGSRPSPRHALIEPATS